MAETNKCTPLAKQLAVQIKQFVIKNLAVWNSMSVCYSQLQFLKYARRLSTLIPVGSANCTHISLQKHSIFADG